MQQPQRFQLEVRIEVREVREYGQWVGNNALSVNHTVQLGTLDFLELAAILGRFHELGEKIKSERSDSVESAEKVSSGE